VTHEARGFSLICVATHIGAISIIRRWICLRFSQVHVHCKISLDVGTLHSATGASYLALAQNLTTVCTKKCRCSTTETDPCRSSTLNERNRTESSATHFLTNGTELKVPLQKVSEPTRNRRESSLILRLPRSSRNCTNESGTEILLKYF